MFRFWFSSHTAPYLEGANSEVDQFGQFDQHDQFEHFDQSDQLELVQPAYLEGANSEVDELLLSLKLQLELPNKLAAVNQKNENRKRGTR